MEPSNNNTKNNILEDLDTIVNSSETSENKGVIITEELNSANRTKYSLYVGIGVLFLLVIASSFFLINYLLHKNTIDEGVFSEEVQRDILAENKRLSGDVNVPIEEQERIYTSSNGSYNKEIPFTFENLGQRHNN